MNSGQGGHSGGIWGHVLKVEPRGHDGLNEGVGTPRVVFRRAE